jgi:perosamine synthetase
LSEPSKSIPLAAPVLTGREAEYVADCIRSNWISSKGRYITEFESSFSRRVGAQYGVAVSSGTSALHVALAALEVSQGDQVILPTFTMICCINVVRYLGAKAVLVDSEESTWNIDPSGIREAIGPSTKVVMPVHLYGHPARMDTINELANEHGLCILEDAAEAHGAEFAGRPVGSIGDVGAFSFYANKIVTTGEGGMIVTNDGALAKKCAALRDQGYDPARRKWLVHDQLGFNYRMTNIQAAIGLAQTERMSEFVEKHRSTAAIYSTRLRSVPGITLPPEAPWARNVYWMYTILVDPTEFGLNRDEIMIELEKLGIDSRSTFLPIHRQPVYKDVYKGQAFPVADSLSSRGLNLPSGNNTTVEEVERVCSIIGELARH